jgi:hypothetical protein
MESIFCPGCSFQQPLDHRYCISCGTELPTHLLHPSKTARFFAGIKVDERDPEHGYLRVSIYRSEQQLHSGEDSITVPRNHVRFSVWVGDESRCVLSLPVSEARELQTFLDKTLIGLDDTLYANT